MEQELELDRSFAVRPEEAVGLLMFAVLVVLSIVHNSPLFEPVRKSRLTFFTAAGLALFLLSWGLWEAWLALSRRRDTHSSRARRKITFWGTLRDWMPALLCVGIYESMKHLHLNEVIFWLGIRPKDDWMIWFDETVFGGHASVALQAWISGPMTTYMRAVYYVGYYVYPFIVGLVLYLFRPRRAFREFVLAFLATAFIGYTFYVLIPVAGPRFSEVKHLYTVPLDPAGTLERLQFDALRYEYDCFPSLHTAIPLTALVIAFRHVRPLAAVLAPFVLSTVLSTLYLRMHYVADVLAGVLLVPVSTLIGLKGDLWWARLHGFLARRLQAVDWRRGAVAVRAGVAALVLVWIVSLVI